VPRIPGNASDLREALTNLILNAIDAMPRGGKLSLATRQEKEEVLVAVQDSGTGMSEEVRRRCFEPFFTTKGQAGTGLGLAMVHGIVRRHEGRIEVASQVGRGTTFTLHFPIRSVPEAAGAAATEKPGGSGVAILVVEDQSQMREFVRALLVRDGHTVDAAVDGREALVRLGQRHYDLVITDRAMPGLSGDHLALAIQKEHPETPVILLTGFGEFMNAAGEKPEGVRLVLSKPVTVQALRDAVAQTTMRPA
jgi:CheY-like chemotaxis protein